MTFDESGFTKREVFSSYSLAQYMKSHPEEFYLRIADFERDSLLRCPYKQFLTIEMNIVLDNARFKAMACTFIYYYTLWLAQ